MSWSEEYPMPYLTYSGRLYREPSVYHSGGPDRVADEEPPKGWQPRPVIGFTVPPTEPEPLLWDGDQG